MRVDLRAVWVCSLLSCGSSRDGSGLFGDGGSDSAASAADSDAGATSGGDATSGEDSLDSTAGASSDGDHTPLLDVGAHDTGVGCDDPEGCSGCTAVDILFVIDNSGSMCLKQEALAAAFPGFVDAMGAALPAGTDLHVAITTSGFQLGGSHSENNCMPAEPLATIDQFYVRPTEGMVEGNGLQGRLLEHDGKRWFEVDTGDAAGMQELKTWFSEAAVAVNCSVSSFEFNASGAAWAMHEANAATNDGFVRDADAALVLFILSDEADQSLDMETVEFLHDTVVAKKQECGGDACIVSGGLFSQFCTPANNAAWTFLSSFGEEPVWGDIGIGFGPPPDYAGTVGDALAQVVAQQCENLPPQG